ncbi:hypothetical protein LINGRAHAP2_LOCUS5239, partial [Linum grandiflorum]
SFRIFPNLVLTWRFAGKKQSTTGRHSSSGY